jgi:hypothetical protein
MNNEGVSSHAVIDNQNNVVGNISTVDVKVICCPFRWIPFALHFGQELSLTVFA